MDYDYFEDKDSELTKEVKTFVEILKGEICCEYKRGMKCDECYKKFGCSYDYSGWNIFEEIERILENYNVLKARYLIMNDESFTLNEDAKSDIKEILDFCIYDDGIKYVSKKNYKEEE